MANKRTANTDLNHQNWEKQDKPEKAGTMTIAPEEVLQKRIIKTATRRTPISSPAESNTKSAFGSFTGFNKAPVATTSFAFLNKIAVTKEDTSTMNGISTTSIFTQPSTVNSPISKSTENKSSDNEKDEYYAKLKGLNESVSNWIKKHVDNNPLINLRPIFKDYDRYFDELELLKSAKPAVDTCVKSNDDSSTLKKELSSFVFKSTDVPQDEGKKQLAMSQFSFSTDTKESSVSAAVTPAFNFGSIPATTSAPSFSFSCTTKTNPSGSFSFGSPSPFKFTNVAQPTNNEEATDEQEDEPPKVVFTPVVEEGHTYSVKCKVFVKNEDSFGDRGIGTLYLKPVPNSEKIQLIVRADTNLGKLLCNFILSKSIPTKRIGKKDVMLVCLPTPESTPPPVPMLLRVKSPEQADELLKELEKHKK